MFVDYYAVLSLQPSCSAKEVREAFKRLALLHHPDRQEDGDVETFRGVIDAYDVLSNPARRYLYDLGYAEALQLRGAGRANDLAPATSPESPREAARAVPLRGSALQTVRGLRGGMAEQQQQQQQQQQKCGRGDVGVGAKKATVFSGCIVADDFSTHGAKQSSVVTSKSSQLTGNITPGLQGDRLKTIHVQLHQRDHKQERMQPNAPQFFGFGVHPSARSFFVSKPVSPQWDSAKYSFRRVQHTPEAEIYCRSVVKTWRTFFHVPEIFQEEK